MRRTVVAWFLLVLTAVSFLPVNAAGLMTAGDIRPSARVADADGRILDLGSVGSRPTLVVYEDKDSANLNASLKADLSKLAQGDRYRTAIALIPVADVRGYDFWPVRGFVKDAIRSESRKIGSTIYCDWDGSFGKALGARHGTSTFVLFDKSGRVLFAHEGAVPPAEARKMIGLLRAQVDG
jgi:hypothetical protein